jgi:hypothetical protein
MAIASVGSIGTGVSSTSGTSFTLVTTVALAAGDFITLEIATANDTNSTGTGQNNAHSKVSGGTGFWFKLGEYNQSAGAAGDGVTTSKWLFLSTGTNGIGTTFTMTLGTAVVDKAASGWKFTKGAGTAIRLVRGAVSPLVYNAQSGTPNGYGSVSFAGMASGSRLYSRALGKKASTTTAITPSTNFTAITGIRSRNNAAAVYVTGEFRINTSTGETSNPTQAVAGPTSGVFVALEEYTPSPAAYASVDVGTASCFKDQACTVPVSADSDEVLGVKDPTTGLILQTATATTGPLYRPNGTKPYLECSTARFFDAYTGGFVHVGDNVGEYMLGAAVRFDDIVGTSQGPGALQVGTSVRPAAAIRAQASAVSAWAYSINGANFDTGPALTLSADCVISSIVSQAGFEGFLNGLGNGATGLDSAPFSGSGYLNIAGSGAFVDRLVGRIYGFRFYQGQDSTSHAAMVASLSALLPKSFAPLLSSASILPMLVR